MGNFKVCDLAPGAGSRESPHIRPERTICCRRRRSILRAVRAAASRSGGPQACPAGCARNSERGGRIDIRSKNHCSDPPPHSFQRLLHNACFGLPPQRVGSLDGRRRRRLVVVFVVLCGRPSERGRHRVQNNQREPLELGQPVQRVVRALRPASAEAVPATPAPAENRPSGQDVAFMPSAGSESSGRRVRSG